MKQEVAARYKGLMTRALNMTVLIDPPKTPAEAFELLHAMTEAMGKTTKAKLMAVGMMLHVARTAATMDPTFEPLADHYEAMKANLHKTIAVEADLERAARTTLTQDTP